MQTLKEDFNQIVMAVDDFKELLPAEPEVCDECKGEGMIDIEIEPDIETLIPCPECRAGFYEAKLEEIDQDR